MPYAPPPLPQINRLVIPRGDRWCVGAKPAKSSPRKRSPTHPTVCRLTATHPEATTIPDRLGSAQSSVHGSANQASRNRWGVLPCTLPPLRINRFAIIAGCAGQRFADTCHWVCALRTAAIDANQPTRDPERRSTVRGSQTSQIVTPKTFSHSPYGS